MAAIPDKVDLRKYIEIRDGRPHIRGRKVPVMFIVDMSYKNHESLPGIAYNFTISEEEVAAALLYYLEHKIEMDIQDAADLAEDEAFFRRMAENKNQE